MFITKTNDTIFLTNNDFILQNYESLKIVSEVKQIKLRKKQIKQAFLIENDTITSIFLCDLLASGCGGMLDYYIVSDKNQIINNKMDFIVCNLSLYIQIQNITKKSLFD